MRFDYRSFGLRFVIAVTVMLSLLALPIKASSSHDPSSAAASEQERHAVLSAEATEHGHVHDDGEPAEQAPGHNHAHDVTDHSHDTPGAPPALVIVRLSGIPAPSGFYDYPGYASAHYRQERPPRVQAAA